MNYLQTTNLIEQFEKIEPEKILSHKELMQLFKEELNKKKEIVYLTIYTKDYIDDPDYYKKAKLLYQNYLKDTDLIQVRISYPNNQKKTINTPILNKAEAMNILKILTDK
jgi:hypothetical protein